MKAMQFGKLTVQPVSDGHLLLDLASFFPDVPVDAWTAYRDGTADGKLRCPLTTFIVRASGRTVLVDTGLGPRLGRFEGECGHLPAALAEAGVRSESVDAVIFTHLHPDHVGWNCTEVDGTWRPTFPNARYIVNRVEWDRWVDVQAGYIARNVRPLADAGQLELVSDGHEPLPGVCLFSTPGHTAGHVSVLVYDGGEGGVITGDAAHHPAEIEHPEWSPSADDDRDLAAGSRRALVERVEADGLLILGGHFPAPHAGRIIRVEQRRLYQPLAT